MKFISILFLSFFSFQNLIFAQENSPITIFGYGNEKAFNLKGETSDKFINAIYKKYPEAKRTGCIHRFHDIAVPGIEGKLRIKILEGVQTVNDCGGFSFSSFMKVKYKIERVNRMTHDESFGVLIYVSKKYNKSISTDQEANSFVAFIKELIQS